MTTDDSRRKALKFNRPMPRIRDAILGSPDKLNALDIVGFSGLGVRGSAAVLGEKRGPRLDPHGPF